MSQKASNFGVSDRLGSVSPLILVFFVSVSPVITCAFLKKGEWPERVWLMVLIQHHDLMLRG